jgi:hypothetical protein
VGKGQVAKGVPMRTYFTGLLLLGGACLAQGENSQCERLFSTPSEIATCNTLVRLYLKPFSDDELRESVSRQVYGVSAAEVAAQRKKREDTERAAAEEVAKDATKDHCSQVFAVALDSEVCRWYLGISPGARSDDELREAIGAKLLQMKQDEAFRTSVLSTIRNLRQSAIQQRIHEKEAAEQERVERLQAAQRERAYQDEIRSDGERADQIRVEAEKRVEHARFEQARVRTIDAATEPERRRLADEYEGLLSRLFSNYNYIEVKTEKSGKDFVLYGKHAFFSKYTFQIGPEGPRISRWIAERARDLGAARIRRVGVRSDSGDATYYTVP